MARSRSYWDGVLASGAVPADRPLTDLTVELTRLLGDPDPHLRDEVATTVLSAWIGQGVYDDLLLGLGDGIAAGLDPDASPAHRRAASVRVLGACLDRATAHRLVTDGVVLGWADRLLAWFAGDLDPAAVLPGAEILPRIAAAADLGPEETFVVLSVLADRVAASARLSLGELDALVDAALTLIARTDLALTQIEAFFVQLGRAAVAETGPDRNAEAFLRTVHLQLSIARPVITARADAALILVDLLRELRRTPQPGQHR